MTRQKKQLLICCGIVLLSIISILAVSFFKDMQIYPMSFVNGWKRVTHFIPNERQKEENFIIYNHFLKSEKEIRSYIVEFNDQTISRDSIEKYPEGYFRRFFKRSYSLNKNYKEAEDGSDIIHDHLKNEVFRISWKLEDSFVRVKIDWKTYKIPINDDNWRIITSIKKIKEHPEYLYSDYTPQ